MLFLCGLGVVSALGQPLSPPPAPAGSPIPDIGIATMRLWNGPAPGAQGEADEDAPTLTVFQPHPGRENGVAIVVAPGGAYLHVSMNLEGRQVADWFAARGITAFVLKYRLGPRHLYPIPLWDAERAIRFVRFHAAEYHLSANRVGMIGFSAGGHLTAMTGTTGGPGDPSAADPIDRLSSRPDFLILGYPWINAMQPSRPPFIPSYETLMKIPAGQWRALEANYNPALYVTARTPPTFIYSTTDDAVVPVQASLDFYRALVSAGVPAEMHLFGRGRHGSGLGDGDPALDLWPVLLEAWLRQAGWLTRR